MKIKFTRINLLSLELLGVLLLHFGEIAVRFPCNHTNALLFNYRDCIIALVVFEIVYLVLKREICLTFWLIFMFSFAIPIVEDKCNILIHYETWISRGMPSWGHVTFVDKKYIEATSAHEAYFIYNNVDCLIADEGQELSQFLPQEATDIWISHESGFGHEDWQVSCIVLESDFQRFVSGRPHMKCSVVDVFGLDANSYKMCNLFYQTRLCVSPDEIGHIRTRDGYLECYEYEKDSHWHLTYCYDRNSNILSCDFGR